LFRENTAHNQISLCESFNWMNKRIQEKLKRSWAPIYYEHVFCKIDEKPFAVLYSDVGRPNFPVNISLSLEFIKHFLNLSDDELIDNFYFNYLVNYAVGIRVLGELNLAKRTIYEFRDRIYKYTLAHPDQDDLIFGQFVKLIKGFAEIAGISMKEQRMDSTMFMSNIKKAGRLSLAFDVLIKSVKVIPKGILPKQLEETLQPEFKTKILFKTKASETESTLDHILSLCQEARDTLKSISTPQVEEALRIISRFISEQAELDENTNKLRAKNSKEISASSLQSVHDEDATFRNKNGKSQSGYVANITETCDKNNPVQLITDYAVAPNIKSDMDFIKERISIIKENTNCEKVTVDGGYYCEDPTGNVEDVEVNFTDMTGRCPSDKIPVTDFELDEKNEIIITCPNGTKPIHAGYKNGQSVAHFPTEACKHCEHRDRCPAKPQKKSFVLRFSSKTITAAIQRNKINANRTENISSRAGIEGTNSALKRRHRMDKLQVRGKVKCNVVVGLKVIAQNIRRFVNYMLGRVKVKNLVLQG
jgi:hypothetical protein